MQTKFSSFQEACASTAVGFVLSLLIQQYVINPLFDLKIGFASNLAIVSIFTVASVARSYILRRIFNKKVVHAGK